MRPYPPYLVRGEGARVTDADGHEAIDCSNNYTALIHGHRHPAILEAVAETLEWGISFGNPTPLEVEMGELLTERYPTTDRWRFTNSGTEAVMQAIRIARAFTGRDLIVRFGTAYHGTYDDVTPLEAPGLPESVERSVLVLPVGDIAAVRRAFEDRGRELAAILLDLMPNRAGMIPCDPAFVQEVRALTEQAGSLLIVDEVISLRLAYGGLHSEYGVHPDLVTMGKVIGGGFPIGAVGGREPVMAITDPSRSRPVLWGGTFSGNPVSLAAGMAALRAYGSSEIERLNAGGDALRSRLEAGGLRVSGRGSLMKVCSDRPIQDVWWPLYRAGVLITTSHMIALSTAMGEQDLDEIASTALRALA